MVTFFFFIYFCCVASAKGAESFFNTIILNSYTEVSDQGLSALGAGIKELRSLTNLSLDFGASFLWLHFVFLFLLCSAPQKARSPFLTR